MGSLRSNEEGWVRVPVGEEAGPFITVPFTRTVLVVARSVTTAFWLIDFLPELLCDTRVQVLFTVEDESPSVYDGGAHELLRIAGVAKIPWSQATATRFDLAICATHRGSLANLRSPLIITPHGPGFGKPDSASPGAEIPVPNLDRPTADGPVTTMVLSHSEQATLFEGHPPQVRLLVAGDPVYDRLQASVEARSRYRRAFGVRGRRLVVLSSTWGPGAQLGRHPDLSERLRGELPVDEYALAMIVHPNIWFGHSKWQLNVWLKRAMEAGVVLVPPFADEWRAAVVASDLVIMDHGSVGFYAAAIGRPVILNSFGHQYLIASSPLAELGRRAPELELANPPQPQVERVIEDHDPTRYDHIVGRMFDAVGKSHEIMRQAIYEIIGLEPPRRAPRVLAVAPPDLSLPSVMSHHVFAELRHRVAEEEVAIAISRFPANLDISGGGGTCRHLAADVGERDPGLLESAALVLGRLDEIGPQTGGHWAERILESYPGCRFAVVLDEDHDSVVAYGRGGSPLFVRREGADRGAAGTFALEALASIPYVLDLSHLLPLTGRQELTVELGSERARVIVEAAPTRR